MVKMALKYRDEHNLSIIPCNGKKIPTCDWKKYQEKIASKKEIREWFFGKVETNIGIVTGKVSNLVVVDVDSSQGYKELKKFFPKDLLTPTVTTPRGSHFYFKYPAEGISNSAGLLLGVDVRGNGGYVVAPPSKNDKGGCYIWAEGLSIGEIEMPELPKKFIEYMQNAKRVSTKATPKTTTQFDAFPTKDCFSEGSRDDSLYRVAQSLIRGGCEESLAYETLQVLAIQSSPSFSAEEADGKIARAIENAKNIERNIAEEVAGWIETQEGIFTTISLYGDLALTTKKEKAAARVKIGRLKDKGILEQYGNKSGTYRRVENSFNFITFDETTKVKPYPINLPLDLNKMATVFPGSILMFSGETNSAKTAIALNIVAGNKNKLPIRFLSSEMDKEEFVHRFRQFPQGIAGLKPDENFDIVRMSRGFADAIAPDRLNVLDYLESDPNNFSAVVEEIRWIHDRLENGVCVIFAQKKKGALYGRGAEFLQEKPRLSVSLFELDNGEVMARITKAKFVEGGSKLGYESIFRVSHNGSKLQIVEPWDRYNYYESRT